MKKIKPTKGARLCARYGYYQKRNYCYKKSETFFSYLIPRIAKRPPLPYAVHARRVIVRDNLDHPSFLHAVTATSVETRQGAVSWRTRGMNGPRLEKKKKEKEKKGEREKKQEKRKGKKISVPILLRRIFGITIRGCDLLSEARFTGPSVRRS